MPRDAKELCPVFRAGLAVNITTITDLSAKGNITLGDALTDTMSLVALTTVNTNQKIQFRDTGLFIQSAVDGKLTISADGIGTDDIILSGTITGNAAWTTSGTLNSGALTATSAALGGGTVVTKIVVYAAALTPASVAAATTAEQVFTVTGLATTDKVFVNKPSLNAGVGIANARVSAVDTLAITYVNATAAAVVPTAETYLVVAIRS